jgi:hypothetical protein
MANYVKNFDNATGSKDAGNISTNAIDVYEQTRFSSNEAVAYWEGSFKTEVIGIAAIDLGLYRAKERKTPINYTSNQVLNH